MKKIINLPKGMDVIYDSSEYCKETDGDQLSDWIDNEIEKFVDHRGGKLKKDITIQITIEEGKENE